MLDHISIRDFAIIDNVDLDFSEGFSVITGETGSGKSIVVTAISLALGSRADSSYVRNGKDKAIIELTATIDDEPLVITREINSQGKNLCKFNGRTVTLGELEEQCKRIADIHGQYDNQSLLNADNHLSIIDNYSKKEISSIKNSYEIAFEKYTESKRNLDELLSKEKESKEKEDFLRFQLKEIQEASPLPGEDAVLSDKLSILQNSEKIYKELSTTYQELLGEGKAYENIGNAINSLENLTKYSEELAGHEEVLRDMYYKLEDLGSSIRKLKEETNITPEEIDEKIERLNVLSTLKRKYAKGNGTLEEVISYASVIEKELSIIDNFDAEKNRLTQEYQEAYTNLELYGDQLTKARLKSAYDLKNNILKELLDLNFDSSDLDIVFGRRDTPTINGFDTAEMMITLNKGEDLKPLAKTSSGGELSRIMLAIKKITADFDEIPTLIFDEIDQGISGKTAHVVGKKLREISKKHQVISITHLPQIAAASDTSYRIFKESDTNNTYTHVEKLGQEGKIREIARLLAGENITDSAIENAKGLIIESAK